MIAIVVRAHYWIRCAVTACIASAEVCAARAIRLEGAPIAKRKFERAGWVHDPFVKSASGQPTEWVEENGAGNWYCRSCARKRKIRPYRDHLLR